ncbi:unnamed protein product [Cuscuta europaea]|uniref:Uncharacterized protein n=1 Tax=Cuscuta europaea TaxID=41803 RepID=A0A9P0YUF2_CUSEU|nr:unnamed protein product [Cuscuta europaea]
MSSQSFRLLISFPLIQKKVESPTPGAPSTPTRRDGGEVSHGDSISRMAVGPYIRAHQRLSLISGSLTSTRSLRGFEPWSIDPNLPPLDQLSYLCVLLISFPCNGC